MTAPSRLPEARRAYYADHAERMRQQASASYHANKQLKGPTPGHHTLVNRDVASMLADCAICGRVPIKLKGRAWRCSNAVIEDGIRYHYNISGAEFREMLARQGNACAVCRVPFEGVRREVDHDHSCCPGKRSCGKCVRGVLCWSCNNLLGKVGDDIDRLLAAIDYLMEKRT